MAILTTSNEVETKTFGKWLGERLPLGAVVALNGNLGAGKTTLVKGLMQALPSNNLVQSPAFTLVGEYTAKRNNQRITVYHMDFYRLESLNDMDAMLFAEYIDDPDSIKLIEWANKFIDELADDYLSIYIEAQSVQDDDSRNIHINTVGDNVTQYAQLIKELEHYRD